MSEAANEASSTTPLRIATWNMDHWRRPAAIREAGWRRLRTLVSPRLALLQETVPPRDLPRASFVFREIGRTRQWGSAVVAIDQSITLDEIWSVRTPYSPQTFTLTNTFPGSVAVARAQLPGMQPITLVSVYTVIDVYSQTTLLRTVADLIPLFDSADGSRVVLGGDLNLGTDVPRGPNLTRYEAIIRAVESLGLVNLYERVSVRPPPPNDCRCGHQGCHHLTTRAGGGQFDYLFASRELASQAVRVVRFDDTETQALSDHWPIGVDFELVPKPIKRRWDIEAFTREIETRHGSAAARAIDIIADWAARKERELHAAGPHRWTLTRFPIPDAVDPKMWLQMDLDGIKGVQSTIKIRAKGDVAVQFQWMGRPPFDKPERRSEVAERLNQIEGIRVTRITGRPTFPLHVLEDPDRLEHVLAVLDWIVDETVQAEARTDTHSVMDSTLMGR